MKNCQCGCKEIEGNNSCIPTKCVICEMSKVLKVLSDSTRLKILYSLLEGDKCVNSIQEDVNMSQSAVSHQLRVLKDINLVKCVKNSNRVIYALADDHIKTILEMVQEHINEGENINAWNL